MSPSSNFRPLGVDGLPSDSLSDLELRLDFGFLKAKKCPIFFLKVREPEDVDVATVGEASDEMGLQQKENNI